MKFALCTLFIYETFSIYCKVQARFLEPAFNFMQDNRPTKYFKVDFSRRIQQIDSWCPPCRQHVQNKQIFSGVSSSFQCLETQVPNFCHFTYFRDLTNCRLICSQIRYCLLQMSCQFLSRCCRASTILQWFCNFLLGQNIFWHANRPKYIFDALHCVNKPFAFDRTSPPLDLSFEIAPSVP